MHKPYPDYTALAQRVSGCRNTLTSLSAQAYRSTTPRYANTTDLLSGKGSRTRGGRWNPIGVECVYASLTPETAMAETLSHFRYYHIPIHAAMPRTFVAIRFQLRRVLDLTTGKTRQRLQVSEERLLEEDWRRSNHEGRESLTQAIGRAVYEAGFEALLVSSAAHRDGHVIACFPNNLGRSSGIEPLRHTIG